MSFRGKKRENSFGNRNFNDRGGNMGGNGGRNNNMGGRGLVGVNPWESGVMPGRGILPTPSNNLSLASPQTQLAIASNLLSNLLRTQQDNTSQVQAHKVPSLLSLNNFSGSGPNFGGPGQQNFSQGRFNDRSGRHQMKNQRPQPYNKIGNRARDGVAGRRGPSSSAQHSRVSGNQHMNGSQSHRNDKSSKANTASKQNQSAKKEQQDVKTSDKTNDKTELSNVKSEDLDETVEDKKHDWKNESVEAEGSQGANPDDIEMKKEDEIKKEDSEKKDDKSPAKGSDKDGKSTGKKSETRHAESRYADVPMSHMFCHVCNKHMWDGSSFENHLRGRAHQLMMDKLDESYKLKVDLMRHELRVAEEQRELTLTNSKRRGKKESKHHRKRNRSSRGSLRKVKLFSSETFPRDSIEKSKRKVSKIKLKVSVDLNVRDYCTMCDLNFYGTLSSHRKSEKHQQLKTFLHPRCGPCSKEFPSRIEYDEHCLTPQHMKNAVQNEEQKKLKKKDKLAKGEAEIRTAEEEDKDVGSDFKGDKQDDQKEPEDGNYLTDLVEELTDYNVKIPNYKYCRQHQVSIGRSMVKQVQGHYCEKCRRFMSTEEDMLSHLRTITHYRNFVQEAKVLISSAEKAASKEKGNEDESVASAGDDEEFAGSCKRRKVSHNPDGSQNDGAEESLPVSLNPDEKEADKQQKDELIKSPEKKDQDPKSKDEKDDSKKDDKYDPLEAEAEVTDGEEENAEIGKGQTEQEDPKKDEAVEKMLDDMEESDCTARNLIDDTEGDKIDLDDDVSMKSVEDAKNDIKNDTKKDTKNDTVVSEPVVKSTPRGRGQYYRQRGNRARRSRR